MRLARLCPVLGVRERGRAAKAAEEKLGSLLQCVPMPRLGLLPPCADASSRSGTRDVHEASDALIRSKAALAFSDPALWSQLLSQFYYVFRSLETALERGSATDSRVHALHGTFFSRLARSSAFLSDVRQARVTSQLAFPVSDSRGAPYRLPTTAAAPLPPRRFPRPRSMRTG